MLLNLTDEWMTLTPDQHARALVRGIACRRCKDRVELPEMEFSAGSPAHRMCNPSEKGPPMKPLSLTAQCGHAVALTCPGSTPVSEVQRRTRMIEQQVCDECWSEDWLAAALIDQQRAGLPSLQIPPGIDRVPGLRARHALFPAVVQRIGHLQQHTDQAEWQRLAACLVALRRETSASRWAAWRWLDPDGLIEAVGRDVDRHQTLVPVTPSEGWGECPEVEPPKLRPCSYAALAIHDYVGKSVPFEWTGDEE